MPIIDKMHIKDQNGTEQSFSIGADAVNVTFNPDATDSSPNSVNTRIQDTIAHMNKKAVTDSTGVHGMRYNSNNNKFEIETTSGQQSPAGGGGEGDMTKAEFVNPQSNLLLVSKGGTGNANGYVQIGALAGSTIGTKATAEGNNTIAQGNYSHAEGYQTSAVGDYCHTEGYNTRTEMDYSHTEGKGCAVKVNFHFDDEDVGVNHVEGQSSIINGGSACHVEGDSSQIIGGQASHAEGHATCVIASGSEYIFGAHAEGRYSSALAEAAHAEGRGTEAYGKYSHAEGYRSEARGIASHAEGGYATGTSGDTYAIGNNSHAEGVNTTAYGEESHTEGYKTYAVGYYSHSEGDSTIAELRASHAEGISTYAKGIGSHAEGEQTCAKGTDSHAEGYYTYANGNGAHAEGFGNSLANVVANSDGSHAEGRFTTAFEKSSHAEGDSTIAVGEGSHAEGTASEATGRYSHAEGAFTEAGNYASHAGGHLNAHMTTGGNYNNTVGTAFVIGNGTSSSNLSNAFVVEYNGTVRFSGTPQDPNADYAEFFEQSDNNEANEDRVGYFVTFDEGKKIKLASSEDEYILGIISGAPSILGNGDCSVQNGMVLRDEFNRVQYEPAPKYEINKETGEEEPVLDDEGNPVYQGTKPVYNPDYDSSQPYIPREQRPEWAAVGMLGVLPVRDDGTCEVNGYCTVADGGIATKADVNSINKYRVIGRKTENVVEVVFR